jgi:hypothetical protein
VLYAHFQGQDAEFQSGLAQLEGSAQVMLDDLLWWVDSLKSSRGR